MPSSYSDLGLNLQATGENSTTWGEKLNDEVIELIEEALKGRCAYALSGAKTLTNTNAVSNEARNPIQHITSGTGGTVTVPDVTRLFFFINDATGDVTVSASGGTDAVVSPGERVFIVCTGTNCYRMNLLGQGGDLDMNGYKVEDLGDPTNAQDAATKQYVDDTAFDMAAGALPGQTGNAGNVLTTDGTTASWLDFAAYTADQDAKAIAFAVSL